MHTYEEIEVKPCVQIDLECRKYNAFVISCDSGVILIKNYDFALNPRLRLGKPRPSYGAELGRSS